MTQFYETFLASLAERYPHKSDLVNALVNTLHLEKESVYRRLRKDVSFSAEEMLKIASAWNISLDNIASSNPNKIRPFQLKLVEFADPKEEDYNLLELHNKNLKFVAQSPGGQLLEVLNSLPYRACLSSEILTRFFTMKWLYKYDFPDRVRPMSEIHISERMRKINEEHTRWSFAIPEVYSVSDNRMINNLVDEIAYHHSIGMVTDEEVALLKKDLLSLMDYVEAAAERGQFPSGQKFNLYQSHSWIDSEFILVRSQQFNLSFVRLFERNMLGSSDSVVFEKLMNKAMSVRRSAVLLSGSNDLQRIELFSRLKKLIIEF